MAILSAPENRNLQLRKLESANQAMPMPRLNAATAHMFIVNPLRGGGVKVLFTTHPPMGERIRRLEAMAAGLH